MIRSIAVSAFALMLLGAAPTPATVPDVTVRMHGFAFVPKSVVVHPGARVRFVNDDGDAHTATAKDKSFDSGGLDTGESWDHVFAKPGTYAYLCALHPQMTGTVVVSAEEKK